MVALDVIYNHQKTKRYQKMSNATYLVTKKAQILRIVGESNMNDSITYHAMPVRSDKRECFFNDVEGAEVELINEVDVSLIDTNYAVLRAEVDKVLGLD